MRYLKSYNLFESIFVSKEEVDILLDKISKYDIASLSDVEKNRLVLFSENDKEIIDTIEKMADITNKFKKINAEIRRCQDSGESDGFHLMKDWLELNSQLRPLEALFRKWGIELGDERLSSLMNKQRPDAYGNILESIDWNKSEMLIKIKSEIQDILQYITDDNYIVKIYPKSDIPNKDGKIFIDISIVGKLGVITNSMKDTLLHLSNYMLEAGYVTKSIVNLNMKSFGWVNIDELKIDTKFDRLIIYIKEK